MQQGLLVARHVGFRRDDLPELLGRLLPLFGALLDRRRGHEALEERVERGPEAQHRREQQVEDADERRERDRQAGRGGEAERAADPLHDDHDEQRRGDRNRPAPHAALDAESPSERRAGDQMREHARQGKCAVGPFAAPQHADDGR